VPNGCRALRCGRCVPSYFPKLSQKM